MPWRSREPAAILVVPGGLHRRDSMFLDACHGVSSPPPGSWIHRGTREFGVQREEPDFVHSALCLQPDGKISPFSVMTTCDAAKDARSWLPVLCDGELPAKCRLGFFFVDGKHPSAPPRHGSCRPALQVCASVSSPPERGILCRLGPPRAGRLRRGRFPKRQRRRAGAES